MAVSPGLRFEELKNIACAFIKEGMISNNENELVQYCFEAEPTGGFRQHRFEEMKTGFVS